MGLKTVSKLVAFSGMTSLLNIMKSTKWFKVFSGGHNTQMAGDTDRHKETDWWSHKPLFHFLKESRLEIAFILSIMPQMTLSV
jgi:hypothetical protein